MANYLGDFVTDKTKTPLIYDSSKDYYDGWYELTPDQIIEISQLDIICAAYSEESYSGDAFVLFRKDGKLYEVNDSHCSCHGLRKWEPEETTKEALLKRPTGQDSYGVWKHYGEEMKKIIEAL